MNSASGSSSVESGESAPAVPGETETSLPGSPEEAVDRYAENLASESPEKFDGAGEPLTTDSAEASAAFKEATTGAEVEKGPDGEAVSEGDEARMESPESVQSDEARLADIRESLSRAGALDIVGLEGVDIRKKTEAAEEHYVPCEVCKATGRRYIFFRCKVCNGTGQRLAKRRVERTV